MKKDKKEKGTPHFTETGSIKSCSGCRFHHKLLTLSYLDRSEIMTHVCGLFGTVLAITPRDTSITIEKNCHFNYFKLEMENKPEETTDAKDKGEGK